MNFSVFRDTGDSSNPLECASSNECETELGLRYAFPLYLNYGQVYSWSVNSIVSASGVRPSTVEFISTTIPTITSGTSPIDLTEGNEYKETGTINVPSTLQTSSDMSALYDVNMEITIEIVDYYRKFLVAAIPSEFLDGAQFMYSRYGLKTFFSPTAVTSSHSTYSQFLSGLETNARSIYLIKGSSRLIITWKFNVDAGMTSIAIQYK